MTVCELRAELDKLPQHLPVYVNWEGELHDCKVAEVIPAKRYIGGTWWVDYYAECELDEDEERQNCVFIGSSSRLS